MRKMCRKTSKRKLMNMTTFSGTPNLLKCTSIEKQTPWWYFTWYKITSYVEVGKQAVERGRCTPPAIKTGSIKSGSGWAVSQQACTWGLADLHEGSGIHFEQLWKFELPVFVNRQQFTAQCGSRTGQGEAVGLAALSYDWLSVTWMDVLVRLSKIHCGTADLEVAPSYKAVPLNATAVLKWSRRSSQICSALY